MMDQERSESFVILPRYFAELGQINSFDLGDLLESHEYELISHQMQKASLQKTTVKTEESQISSCLPSFP